MSVIIILILTEVDRDQEIQGKPTSLPNWSMPCYHANLGSSTDFRLHKPNIKLRLYFFNWY